MKTKLLHDNGLKTFALILKKGDKVISSLTDFANQHGGGAAQISAIGAFSSAELGFFDLSKKDYKKIEINGQVEVLSLLGDITSYEGSPKIHVHVVLGKR